MDLANFERRANSGAPVVGARATLYAALAIDPTTPLATTFTDANGYWAFTGLALGTYDILVEAPGSGYKKWYKGQVKIGVDQLAVSSGFSPAAGSVPGSAIASGSITTLQIADNTILDADVNSAAAIAVSKIANIGSGNVLKSNGTTNVVGPVLATDVSGGTPGTVLLSASSGIGQWGSFPRRNLLANGGMRVYQRAVLSTAKTMVDYAYQAADRWKTLWFGGGGAGNVFAYPSGPSGNPGGTMLRCILSQSFGNTAKHGQLQILEGSDTVPVAPGTVSLQAKLQLSAASFTDIRMAVLGWTGAVDAVTHPIAAWNADGVNPTLAASWGYVSTPVNLNVTGAWATYKAENLAVPSNVNNLAIFVWSNNAVNTSGQSWLVSEVQLEAGAVCTPFEHAPLATELARCLRYYEKSYNQIAPPGNVSPNGEVIGVATPAIAASTAGSLLVPAHAQFRVEKRAVPTVVLYASGGATAGAIRVGGAADRTGCTAGTPSTTRPLSYVAVDASSAVAIAAGAQIQYHWTADAEL